MMLYKPAYVMLKKDQTIKLNACQQNLQLGSSFEILTTTNTTFVKKLYHD